MVSLVLNAASCGVKGFWRTLYINTIEARDPGDYPRGIFYGSPWAIPLVAHS
jgi:hypothetical protein